MRLIITILFALFTIIPSFSQIAETYFKPLKYRNIGPFRGGRSNSSAGVVNDPLTYYMGTTGGGLWKTTNAGNQWKNVSDGFFKTGSVGAVAVSESNSNVVFCGMGEHAVRGVMTSYGDGVYKSTDAGKTWVHIGLEHTQHISRISVHPTNPDIIYVAAQGALYAPTKERGIYKSEDGGATWKNILFVDENTGGVELSMDMNSPNVLYAAMWDYQRSPWEIRSGGPGSGLYKSVDSGKTWSKIHNGLPEEKGKMAIAVSRSNSNKVFALIESDSNKDLGGLFVSENGGDSWTLISDDNRLTQRAWYYTEVFTDPNNDNVVYVLSASAFRSIDGGKTWNKIEGVHGDYHDLWINPKNSKNMVISDDGGASISFDNGETWTLQDNMPTAQFYRVNADNLFPYNLYGGQQDNSSVKITNLALGKSNITSKDWSASAGGESAFLAFDSENPTHVMGGSYLGTIDILNIKANASTNIMVEPIQYLGREARNMKYLYNWNAPIIRSKYDTNTFYHCAQMVLRTTNNGVTWEEISPDLTRNIDKKQGNGGLPYTNEAVGAENYGTISYMIESPIEKGVFWTGSDDGFVHVSKDNGATWDNVTPKDLKECLINSIDVSLHDPGTVYIATTRYKFNDYTPGLYKTTDYGKTWKSINSGIPYGAFTRVVREDTFKKEVLYAGTETGIYISFNRGSSWESFQLNLPVTPITDLKVHQGDLLVATSGRSFWILDDLGLLGQYETNIKDITLFQPEPSVYGFWGSPLNKTDKDFKGTSTYNGVNPANGVVIYYNLPKLAKSQDIIMEITNSNGELVNRLSSVKDSLFKVYDGGPPPNPTLSKEEGLNRFVWDRRYPIMPGVINAYYEASFRGHIVSPGTYTITLITSNNTLKTKALILENPHYSVSKEDYDEYHNFMLEMEQNLTEMHLIVNQLKNTQDQIKEMLSRIKQLNNTELLKACEYLLSEMTIWDETMVQRKSKAYDDVENFPNKFTAEYIFLINQTESAIPKVNNGSKKRKLELDIQWKGLKTKANYFIDEAIPKFNQQLWSAGIGAIIID
jgi:photosystem II stability/assembly factor-like uncharacterized protein